MNCLKGVWVFALAGVAFVCAGVSAPAWASTAGSVVTFSGPALETAVSGIRQSAAEEPYYGGGTGVVGFEWGERSDDPCTFAAIERDPSATVGSAYTDIGANRCGRSETRDKSVKMGGGAFVSAVRVCLDGGHDKVKGIQLRGRTVSESAAVARASGEPRAERTNCRDWMDWVECPSETVATGYKAYFSKGDDPDSLMGIRLICHGVSTRDISHLGALEGAVEVTSRVGRAGQNTLDLKPDASNGFRIDQIEWAERNDIACKITVRGQNFDVQPDRRNDSYNGCGKEPRAGSQRDIDLAAGTGINGLRVCTHNDRIKGIGVEVTSWAADNNRLRFTRQDPQSATQPNCREGDFDWTDYVRCPADHIAVGLRLDVTGGDAPREIVGMRLLCRKLVF